MASFQMSDFFALHNDILIVSCPIYKGDEINISLELLPKN